MSGNCFAPLHALPILAMILQDDVITTNIPNSSASRRATKLGDPPRSQTGQVCEEYASSPQEAREARAPGRSMVHYHTRQGRDL
jgi:hypothetical protein